jgi:predicted nucleic acid-binding protein
VVTTHFLIDTSVWVDFLRAADSEARWFLKDLVTSNRSITTTEPVVMELLAGAKSPRHVMELEKLTSGLMVLGVKTDEDYHSAASLYRTVRSLGKTVRAINDCLIAAVALRTGATLVHKDWDFEAIAEVAPDIVMRSCLTSAP